MPGKLPGEIRKFVERIVFVALNEFGGCEAKRRRRLEHTPPPGLSQQFKNVARKKSMSAS